MNRIIPINPCGGKEEFLKEIAWGVLADSLSWTQPGFENFYNSIPAEDRSKFLRLLHFYKFSIEGLEGVRENTRDEYMFISFFTLIEAMVVGSRYTPFDKWLIETKEFPLSFNLKSDIERAKTEYNNDYGANRAVNDFFNKHMDRRDRIPFVAKFEVYKMERCESKEDYKPFDKTDWKSLGDDQKLEQCINSRVRIAYDMRSKFIHSAIPIRMCPDGFLASGFDWENGKYHIILSLGAKDFLGFGIRGVLRYFGYRGAFKYELYQEWLKKQRDENLISSSEYSRELSRSEDNY